MLHRLGIKRRSINFFSQVRIFPKYVFLFLHIWNSLSHGSTRAFFFSLSFFFLNQTAASKKLIGQSAWEKGGIVSN